MEAKTDTLNQVHLMNQSSEDIVQCPSCDAKIKRYEVAEHCEQETERLKQMKLKAIRDLEQNVNEERTTNEERRKPWSVFQKVQKNRQTRLRQRARRRPASPLERTCPICNKKFSQDEIEIHAEQCLRRSNGTLNGTDEFSSDDGEGGDEYEEYEWAGQKRIRVSSLLQGGYASIGVGESISNRNGNQDDEDEDLNVDEDDTHIYGPAQYNESDVISPGSEKNEADVTSYVRRLITENTSSPTPTTSSSVRNEANSLIEDQSECESASSLKEGPTLNTSIGTTSGAIIESLKAKLRHYENQVQNKFKCLICLDDYKNPAISVSCWHVHCEQCWLRSLGARKLCPQCNLITTPKDLRRIYM